MVRAKTTPLRNRNSRNANKIIRQTRKSTIPLKMLELIRSCKSGFSRDRICTVPFLKLVIEVLTEHTQNPDYPEFSEGAIIGVLCDTAKQGLENFYLDCIQYALDEVDSDEEE